MTQIATKYILTQEDLDDLVGAAKAAGRDELFFDITQHEDDGTGRAEAVARRNLNYSMAEVDALVDTFVVIKEEDD